APGRLPRLLGERRGPPVAGRGSERARPGARRRAVARLPERSLALLALAPVLGPRPEPARAAARPPHAAGPPVVHPADAARRSVHGARPLYALLGPRARLRLRAAGAGRLDGAPGAPGGQPPPGDRFLANTDIRARTALQLNSRPLSASSRLP